MTALVANATYRLDTGDTLSVDSDVTTALARAQTAVEDYCHRLFSAQTLTERLPVYDDGAVYPSVRPVTTVTTPSGAYVDGSRVIAGGGSIQPLVSYNTGAAVRPRIDVTYTGGYTAATVPYTISHEIARTAWRILHPVRIEGTPDDADTVRVGGDLVVAGKTLTSLRALDAESRLRLIPYRPPASQNRGVILASTVL